MSRQMVIYEDRTSSQPQITPSQAKFCESLIYQCEKFGRSYNVELRGTAKLLGINKDDLRFIYTDPEAVAITPRWKLAKIIKALPKSVRRGLFEKLEEFRPAHDGNAFKHRKKLSKRQLRNHQRFLRFSRMMS